MRKRSELYDEPIIERPEEEDYPGEDLSKLSALAIQASSVGHRKKTWANLSSTNQWNPHSLFPVSESMQSPYGSHNLLQTAKVGKAH